MVGSGRALGYGQAMRSARRRILIWLLLLPLLYVLVVVLVAVMQDFLVFPAKGRADRGVPPIGGLEVGELEREDGGRFRVVTAPPVGEPRAVAVYFVGNGEDLYSAALGADELRDYGMLVIGVEHAGYGASDGPASVETLLAGATAVAHHARGLADELQVPLVAVGSSLGTFCAVHLAAEGLVDRLLLRAPPTSLLAVAKGHYAWLPVGMFLRHRFDNLSKADRLSCPVLVLHGDRDHVVPLDLGQELVAAIGENAQMLVASGYGHNNLPLSRQGPFGSTIAEFLALP